MKLFVKTILKCFCHMHNYVVRKILSISELLKRSNTVGVFIYKLLSGNKYIDSYLENAEQ